MAFGSFLKRIVNTLSTSENSDDEAFDLPFDDEELGFNARSPGKSRKALAAHLDKAMAEQPEGSAGYVQLIGLDRVRAYFGEAWGEVQDRAHQVARAIIEERISPANSYSRYDELSYMVVFSRLAPDRAQLKCDMIAQEIAARLIAERDGATEAAEKPATAGRSIDEILGTITDHDDVDLALEDMVHVESGVVAVKQDGEIQLGGFDTGDDMSDHAGLTFLHGDQTPQPDPAWMSFKDIQHRYDEILDNIRFFYRPVWQVERQVVSTYFCLPAMPVVGGRFRTGHGVLSPDAPPLALARLDETTLMHAAHEMERNIIEGLQHVLAVPVHFETFAGQKPRRRFLSTALRLDKDLRQRILFEIVGLPAGAPSGRIMEVAQMARPACRAVLMRLSPEFKDLGALSGSSLGSAGLDAGAIAETDEQVLRTVTRFREEASKAKLNTYLHAAHRPELAQAAITAGFQFVDGDAVADIVEHPEGIQRLEGVA